MAHGHHPNLGVLKPFFVFIDVLVRGSGPFLPLLVFALQWCVLPYDTLKEEKVISKTHRLTWLMEGHIKAVFLIWIFIGTSRVLFYLGVKSFHYYFSDHIFLVTSLVAMTQTKLFLANESIAKQRLNIKNLVVLILGWLLICCFLLESAVTSLFYHTVEATWAAFLTGLVIFGTCAHWWTRSLELRENEPRVNVAGLKEPLCSNEKP